MLPLSEKTVIVTRPREQAAALKSELEKLGAQVILFPTIEIVAPPSYADLDAAIKNLSNYDWLVLTSSNAAEHLLRRLTANGVETLELDDLRVCAIGEATFERLRLAQVHVDVLPPEARAENVFAALCEYVGGASELKNLRFLLPSSNIGRDFLPTKLMEAGATIESIITYQTVLPEKLETGKLKALMQGGAIDCLTFTSPSTFNNFRQILGDHNFAAIVREITIACLGETTAHTVVDAGFAVDIVSIAAGGGPAVFAKAIANYFAEVKK